jgi:protein-disulfide isomerase
MREFVILAVLLTSIVLSSCAPTTDRTKAQKDIPVLNKSGALSSTGPAIEVIEKEIDLGIIPVEVGEIVGSIDFYNVGSKPLQVQKVTGPCVCFAGYSGDKLLQPQEGGELQVRFNKSKIPSGRVKRLAKIMTNDPENGEIRTLSQEFTKLQKELHAVHSELKKVTADLKAAASRTPPTKAKTARKSDTTVYPVNIGSSPTLGAKEATVTIVEFVDFQCPHCVREYPKIKKVLQDYPDKVRFVFKHYPLSFHTKAKPVHAATELARLEGGPETFWKMHDMIMANPKQLEITNLRGYAESLGLNLTNFDEVMADEKKIDELLETDMSEARKCKVRGTPVVLINGLRLSSRNIEDYKTRIDKIIAENKKT